MAGEVSLHIKIPVRRGITPDMAEMIETETLCMNGIGRRKEIENVIETEEEIFFLKGKESGRGRDETAVLGEITKENLNLRLKDRRN